MWNLEVPAPFIISLGATHPAVESSVKAATQAVGAPQWRAFVLVPSLNPVVDFLSGYRRFEAAIAV
jgi:hypothetical protein